MGKDLHSLILKFFKEKMRSHSKVLSCDELPNNDEIIYKVNRIEGLSVVHIHLSDSYRYTKYDYWARPKLLKQGDFILIAKPEASYDLEIEKLAKKDKIGIGKIGVLLGALNSKNIWQYRPKQEERTA